MWMYLISESCYVHLITLELCNLVYEHVRMLWYFILVLLLYLEIWMFSFENISFLWERCYSLIGMMFRKKHVMISLWKVGCVFLRKHNEDPCTVAWNDHMLCYSMYIYTLRTHVLDHYWWGYLVMWLWVN